MLYHYHITPPPISYFIKGEIIFKNFSPTPGDSNTHHSDIRVELKSAFAKDI